MTHEDNGFRFHRPAEPDDLNALRFLQEVSLPDVNTAVATPVGAGFNTTDAGSGYDLSGNQRFGFRHATQREVI